VWCVCVCLISNMRWRCWHWTHVAVCLRALKEDPGGYTHTHTHTLHSTYTHTAQHLHVYSLLLYTLPVKLLTRVILFQLTTAEILRVAHTITASGGGGRDTAAIIVIIVIIIIIVLCIYCILLLYYPYCAVVGARLEQNVTLRAHVTRIVQVPLVLLPPPSPDHYTYIPITTLYTHNRLDNVIFRLLYTVYY